MADSKIALALACARVYPGIRHAVAKRVIPDAKIGVVSPLRNYRIAAVRKHPGEEPPAEHRGDKAGCALNTNTRAINEMRTDLSNNNQGNSSVQETSRIFVGCSGMAIFMG